LFLYLNRADEEKEHLPFHLCFALSNSFEQLLTNSLPRALIVSRPGI
jgi:hypothetical protein